MRVAGLAILLFAYWLLLSGHDSAWLIGAGAVSAVVIALLAQWFGGADEEGFPIGRLAAGLLYWPWLAVEIGKSAFSVARIVLSPTLPISPTIIRVPIAQKTATGIATYANSITMTPGTITLEVDRRRGELVVHALTTKCARDLAGGAMARRVARFEGRA